MYANNLPTNDVSWYDMRKRLYTDEWNSIIWKISKIKIPLSLIKWPRLSDVGEKKPDTRLINEIKLIGNRKIQPI